MCRLPLITLKVFEGFTYSAQLFVAHNRCSFPLHTLLADIVDGQCGPALLIKILNRVGICSSGETLIQLKVNQRLELEGLSPEAFTVISADNIDFYTVMHVSSKGIKSVQAVQLLPSLSMLGQQCLPPLLFHQVKSHLGSGHPPSLSGSGHPPSYSGSGHPPSLRVAGTGSSRVAGEVVVKPVACFFKYTVPTSRMNARNPELSSDKPVLAKVPGVCGLSAVMKAAYWRKNLKNVAFPILLKKEV